MSGLQGLAAHPSLLPPPPYPTNSQTQRRRRADWVRRTWLGAAASYTYLWRQSVDLQIKRRRATDLLVARAGRRISGWGLVGWREFCRMRRVRSLPDCSAGQ